MAQGWCFGQVTLRLTRPGKQAANRGLAWLGELHPDEFCPVEYDSCGRSKGAGENRPPWHFQGVFR